MPSWFERLYVYLLLNKRAENTNKTGMPSKTTLTLEIFFTLKW